MLKKGKIFVISAPSGAGKSTIINEILKLYPEFKKPISYTTRKPRSSEQNGIDYFFISLDKFEEMKKQKLFIEWAKVHDNFYATSYEFIKQAMENQIILIKDIDVQGALNLKTTLNNDAILIFIKTPSIKDLEKRLKKRDSDTKDVIEKRLQNAIQELKYESYFDYTIINNNLNETVKKLSCIIDGYLNND